MKRIEAVVGRKGDVLHAGGVVRCFGSFPAGLYLPTADMDLVLVSIPYSKGALPANIPKSVLWRASKLLQQRGVSTNNQVIAKAKVPIIKFVDQKTGIRVDLSFENLSGVEAQETFRQWKAQCPHLVEIVALVKQFLVMRSLNDVHLGGLGGFSIICLVYSYLSWQPKDQHNLGELFLGFLYFWGKTFDLSKKRLEMTPTPTVVDKVSARYSAATNRC
jgi:non-canonical poly(A) RNA polymerase PAPD5/7